MVRTYNIFFATLRNRQNTEKPYEMGILGVFAVWLYNGSIFKKEVLYVKIYLYLVYIVIVYILNNKKTSFILIKIHCVNTYNSHITHRQM